MFGMDSDPASLRPSRIVLEDQALSASSDIPSDREIREAGDDHSTTVNQHTTRLPDDRIGVEPPPALAGAHDVETVGVLTRRLCRAFDESHIEVLVARHLLSDFEQLWGDVETRRMETARREPKGECSGTGPEIEHPLAGLDPTFFGEPVEEAVRKPRTESFVVRCRTSEVDDPTFVVDIVGGGSHGQDPSVLSPQPPPPGVSTSSSSPGSTSTVHLEARRMRSPLA